MLVLVDTNVLLRVVEPGHAQHSQAVGGIRNLSQAGHLLCLVPQVRYEFWVAATRPISANGLGMTTSEAAIVLEKFSPPVFRFFRDERAIYDAWYSLVCAQSVRGKQAHDARLVAAMQRHGLSHILTFNGTDFQRYAGIAILDPQQVPTT